MRVSLERSALLKSLSHVQRVVERRNTIPILANVLIRAGHGQIEFKATDLDLELVETVQAEVTVAGATTVPAHLFHDIVRKLPDGAEVSLDLGADQAAMILRSSRSRFQMQVLPDSDFPDLSAGDFPHGFKLAAQDLKRLIDKTQFAISSEETRYYLNGIYLHLVEAGGASMLRAVATDGHRLAQMQLPAPKGSAGMAGVIIPRKTVNEVLRLIEAAGDEVGVEISAAKIRFTLGPIVLTSKLIDGTFPDYARVIPVGNDKKLLIDRRAFAAAVDRVSTIASERGRAVKLSLTSGKLLLTVTNPDSGSATEEVEVEYTAEALDIGFNARYLLDIAEQLDDDSAVFMLADPGSPTLIQEATDRGALYVLMPMRV